MDDAADRERLMAAMTMASLAGSVPTTPEVQPESAPQQQQLLVPHLQVPSAPTYTPSLAVAKKQSITPPPPPQQQQQQLPTTLTNQQQAQQPILPRPRVLPKIPKTLMVKNALAQKIYSKNATPPQSPGPNQDGSVSTFMAVSKESGGGIVTSSGMVVKQGLIPGPVSIYSDGGTSSFGNNSVVSNFYSSSNDVATGSGLNHDGGVVKSGGPVRGARGRPRGRGRARGARGKQLHLNLPRNPTPAAILPPSPQQQAEESRKQAEMTAMLIKAQQQQQQLLLQSGAIATTAAGGVSTPLGIPPGISPGLPQQQSLDNQVQGSQYSTLSNSTDTVVPSTSAPHDMMLPDNIKQIYNEALLRQHLAGISPISPPDDPRGLIPVSAGSNTSEQNEPLDLSSVKGDIGVGEDDRTANGEAVPTSGIVPGMLPVGGIPQPMILTPTGLQPLNMFLKPVTTGMPIPFVMPGGVPFLRGGNPGASPGGTPMLVPLNQQLHPMILQQVLRMQQQQQQAAGNMSTLPAAENPVVSPPSFKQENISMEKTPPQDVQKQQNGGDMEDDNQPLTVKTSPVSEMSKFSPGSDSGTTLSVPVSTTPTSGSSVSPNTMRSLEQNKLPMKKRRLIQDDTIKSGDSGIGSMDSGMNTSPERKTFHEQSQPQEMMPPQQEAVGARKKPAGRKATTPNKPHTPTTWTIHAPTYPSVGPTSPPAIISKPRQVTKVVPSAEKDWHTEYAQRLVDQYKLQMDQKDKLSAVGGQIHSLPGAVVMTSQPGLTLGRDQLRSMPVETLRLRQKHAPPTPPGIPVPVAHRLPSLPSLPSNVIRVTTKLNHNTQSAMLPPWRRQQNGAQPTARSPQEVRVKSANSVQPPTRNGGRGQVVTNGDVIEVDSELLQECQRAAHADEDGDLPLHLAVVHEHVPVIEKLMYMMYVAKIPLDHFNNLRQTPLHLAVITQNEEITLKLLHGGANPNLADRKGNTGVHLAIEKRTKECLEAILIDSKHDVDLDIKNYEGFTPLHQSVLASLPEYADLLLTAGVAVDVPDGKSGRTALFHAAENKQFNIASLLLQAGASVNVANYSGNTAVQAANGRGHTEMVALLIKYGADASHSSREPQTDSYNSGGGKHTDSGRNPIVVSHNMLQVKAAVRESALKRQNRKAQQQQQVLEKPHGGPGNENTNSPVVELKPFPSPQDGKNTQQANKQRTVQELLKDRRSSSEGPQYEPITPTTPTINLATDPRLHFQQFTTKPLEVAGVDGHNLKELQKALLEQIAPSESTSPTKVKSRGHAHFARKQHHNTIDLTDDVNEAITPTGSVKSTPSPHTPITPTSSNKTPDSANTHQQQRFFGKRPIAPQPYVPTLTINPELVGIDTPAAKKQKLSITQTSDVVQTIMSIPTPIVLPKVTQPAVSNAAISSQNSQFSNQQQHKNTVPERSYVSFSSPQVVSQVQTDGHQSGSQETTTAISSDTIQQETQMEPTTTATDTEILTQQLPTVSVSSSTSVKSNVEFESNSNSQTLDRTKTASNFSYTSEIDVVTGDLNAVQTNKRKSEVNFEDEVNIPKKITVLADKDTDSKNLVSASNEKDDDKALVYDRDIIKDKENIKNIIIENKRSDISVEKDKHDKSSNLVEPVQTGIKPDPTRKTEQTHTYSILYNNAYNLSTIDCTVPVSLDKPNGTGIELDQTEMELDESSNYLDKTENEPDQSGNKLDETGYGLEQTGTVQAEHDQSIPHKISVKSVDDKTTKTEKEPDQSGNKLDETGNDDKNDLKTIPVDDNVVTDNIVSESNCNFASKGGDLDSGISCDFTEKVQEKESQLSLQDSYSENEALENSNLDNEKLSVKENIYTEIQPSSKDVISENSQSDKVTDKITAHKAYIEIAISNKTSSSESQSVTQDTQIEGSSTLQTDSQSTLQATVEDSNIVADEEHVETTISCVNDTEMKCVDSRTEDFSVDKDVKDIAGGENNDLDTDKESKIDSIDSGVLLSSCGTKDNEVLESDNAVTEPVNLGKPDQTGTEPVQTGSESDEPVSCEDESVNDIKAEIDNMDDSQENQSDHLTQVEIKELNQSESGLDDSDLKSVQSEAISDVLPSNSDETNLLVSESDVTEMKLLYEDQSETVADTETSLPEINVPVSQTMEPVSETSVALSEPNIPVPKVNATCVTIPETTIPVTETEISLSETKLPVSETDAPVSKTKIPVSETKLPVLETNATVSEKDKPLLETETKEIVTETDSSKTNTPVLPVSESNIPVSEINAPVSEDTEEDVAVETIEMGDGSWCVVMASPDSDMDE